MRERIASLVAEGFEPADDIVEHATEFVTDSAPDHVAVDEAVVRAHAGRLTAELMEEHRKRQLTWRGKTDCDRLDEAFSALERDGILARQDYLCCQTCGHSGMQREADEAAKEGKSFAGYVFFHNKTPSAQQPTATCGCASAR